MASKLITDTFPKTKKDKAINQKFPQTKPRDHIKKDAEGFLKDVKSNTADELSVLKQFDLDSEYGPCIGITRLERWERAEMYGLYPPQEVKEIISRHPNDTSFTECIWYDANI